jgi:hypothetical protein
LGGAHVLDPAPLSGEGNEVALALESHR